MKKILVKVSALCAALAMLLSLISCSMDALDGVIGGAMGKCELEYTSLGGGECELVDSVVHVSEVIIPEYSPDGERVVSIGYSAFSGADCIESVVIPDGVREICDRAFSNCGGIKSITIPDSVTSIGVRAFDYCGALGSVEFGEDSRLVSIGDFAFSSCTSLTEISLPVKLSALGKGAFRYCKALTVVELSDVDGWQALDVSLDESGELIPAALLSDPAAAAECVTVTYAEKYLKKIGEGQ